MDITATHVTLRLVQFNRIDIEVLSVIAQQVLVIQQGLMARATSINFEGREIPLNPCFGVFITVSVTRLSVVLGSFTSEL